MKKFILFAALCCMMPLHAEVFTLWPWKPGANEQVHRRLESLPGLSQEPLLTEELEINGVTLTLETFRADGDSGEILRFLKNAFSAGNLQIGNDTIRLAYKLPGGWIDRWLLIGSEEGKPVTVFRISAPEKLPQTVWPQELPPLPAGAVPVQVIRFVRRGGWYGSFENAPENPAGNLRQTASILQSEGWLAAANESSLGGSGDLFLLPGGRGIAWVCYSGTRGAFYVSRR